MNTKAVLMCVLSGVLVLGAYFLSRHNEAEPLPKPVIGVRNTVAAVKESARMTTSALVGNETALPSVRIIATTPLGELLCDRFGSAISAKEIQIVETHYKELVEEREKLELKLASSEGVRAGTVLITIPAYNEQGVNLYSEFIENVAADLGGHRGAQITDSMQLVVQSMNNGLGAQEQNILLENSGETLRVVHGSGLVLNVGDSPTLAQVVSTGSIKPDNASTLSYLKPLFPARK